ncbi:MAG TPA: YkgJ family cysteine cluster protein [Gemmatimonadales bacterium]|nr:YkgJ family cysteine cluster protein [Gemmatimonadales bacterium]
MTSPPHPVAAAYQALLGRLDRWFHRAEARHPGVIPCCRGCAACCHGPFDISVADALLVREAVAALPDDERKAVRARAGALLARFGTLAPAWGPPWDLASLGEEGFDRLAESLATEPCPLLDEHGACRIYASRPLLCRLMGLPLITPARRVLSNPCPIRRRFPAYAALAPQPFDLDAFEAAEAAFRDAAARALPAARGEAGYETTIAAVLA